MSKADEIAQARALKNLGDQSKPKVVKAEPKVFTGKKEKGGK